MDVTEHLTRMAVWMSLKTNTSIEYFKNLPLEDFFYVVEQITKTQEREKG